MTQLAEYSDVTSAQFGKKIVMDEAKKGFRTYQLIHRTAGYQCAGSVARFDNEAYGVIFEFDGATHGRWFRTEAEARDLFARWTK